MRVVPFGSKRCRGFPSSKHEHDGGVHIECKETFPMGIFQFEDVDLQCLPQFWKRCQRDSLCVLSVTGFETRITLQLINHVLHPDRATATLKQKSQTRLRNMTTRNVEVMNQLSNTPTFQLADHDLRFFEQETQQKTAGDTDNKWSPSDKNM